MNNENLDFEMLEDSGILQEIEMNYESVIQAIREDKEDDVSVDDWMCALSHCRLETKEMIKEYNELMDDYNELVLLNNKHVELATEAVDTIVYWKYKFYAFAIASVIAFTILTVLSF